MAHTYRAVHDGQVFTRKTDRTYSHVVICLGSSEIHPMTGRPQGWGRWAWCSRPDLAEKQAAAARKCYREVRIIPCEVA